MTANAPQRILAIGAHPDDVEIACAGTLARCLERGDAVSLIVMCNGNSASTSLSAEELAAVRSRELKDAAKVLGAETVIEMGLPDFGVWLQREILFKLTDAIRQVRPDVVITHFDADYGSDHNHTLKLVQDATLAASVPGVKTEHPAIPKIPYLYMMEPMGGYGFQPQVYVDITATFRDQDRDARMPSQPDGMDEPLRRHGHAGVHRDGGASSAAIKWASSMRRDSLPTAPGATSRRAMSFRERPESNHGNENHQRKSLTL